MSKIIGFDQATADKQLAQKKDDQRKLTHRQNTKHIHLVKDASPLTRRFSDLERAFMVFSMNGGVA